VRRSQVQRHTASIRSLSSWITSTGAIPMLRPFFCCAAGGIIVGAGIEWRPPPPILPHVIAPDLRGYGDSTWAIGSTSPRGDRRPGSAPGAVKPSSHSTHAAVGGDAGAGPSDTSLIREDAAARCERRIHPSQPSRRDFMVKRHGSPRRRYLCAESRQLRTCRLVLPLRPR
jgi:hypothetical protein